MEGNEQIDSLMSPQLPRPLRDFLKQAHGLRYGMDGSELARAWVAEVGDRLARAALRQLVLLLACPVQLMWHFDADLGRCFEESYNRVSFYGWWQSRLAQAIGVPEPLVPEREEWYARWKPLKDLLKSIRVPGGA